MAKHSNSTSLPCALKTSSIRCNSLWSFPLFLSDFQCFTKGRCYMLVCIANNGLLIGAIKFWKNTLIRTENGTCKIDYFDSNNNRVLCFYWYKKLVVVKKIQKKKTKRTFLDIVQFESKIGCIIGGRFPYRPYNHSRQLFIKIVFCLRWLNITSI